MGRVIDFGNVGRRREMEMYELLEQRIAEWMSYEPEQVVVCSSGTAALHLALEAFQLPQGSEVIVPDYTMIACARAVSMAGLTPVFVDCDETLNMDLALACGQVVEPGRPTCLLAVHVYGRRLEMDGLVRLHDWVIEDLAETHGVKPHSLTDAACWSFFKNKIVAGEEGGAVAFRSREHAAKARCLRSLGFTEAHDYRHIPRGMNYRLSNANAKLILENFYMCQLADKYKSWEPLWVINLEKRREVESWYETYCPLEWRMPERQSPWVYDMRIPGMKRDKQNEVVGALQDAGIAARHGFWPMSLQEEYEKCRLVTAGERSLAQEAASEVVYLPITPTTTEAQCRAAFEVIGRVVG